MDPQICLKSNRDKRRPVRMFGCQSSTRHGRFGGCGTFSQQGTTALCVRTPQLPLRSLQKSPSVRTREWSMDSWNLHQTRVSTAPTRGDHRQSCGNKHAGEKEKTNTRRLHDTHVQRRFLRKYRIQSRSVHNGISILCHTRMCVHNAHALRDAGRPKQPRTSPPLESICLRSAAKRDQFEPFPLGYIKWTSEVEK